MKCRLFTLLVLLGLITSCADQQVKPASQYELLGRDYLYNKESWEFTGRLAYSDANNSLGGSVGWRHLRGQDKVELAGPLGVSRTIIGINGDKVSIKYNGKYVKVNNGSEVDLIKEYTGVSVPVLSLKYWVVGLVDPGAPYVIVEGGFVQLGWNVNYQKMESVGDHWLPKKIKVEKGASKLKLIIDSWIM